MKMLTGMVYIAIDQRDQVVPMFFRNYIVIRVTIYFIIAHLLNLLKKPIRNRMSSQDSANETPQLDIRQYK